MNAYIVQMNRANFFLKKHEWAWDFDLIHFSLSLTPFLYMKNGHIFAIYHSHLFWWQCLFLFSCTTRWCRLALFIFRVIFFVFCFSLFAVIRFIANLTKFFFTVTLCMSCVWKSIAIENSHDVWARTLHNKWTFSFCTSITCTPFTLIGKHVFFILEKS